MANTNHMAILFKQANHQYISEEEPDIEWLSVTTLLGQFKQPFDAPYQASRSSKNKQSKWYGMTPQEIQSVWKAESERAIKLGTWYHDQQEKQLIRFNQINRDGRLLPVFPAQYDDFGNKVAPDQKLVEGVYPEHLLFLKSAGLCGQSDLVEVIDGVVNITDYKTNKEIKTEGYTNWEGITQKMRFPVSHIDDCNLKQYQLQLSVYLHIILKHNPRLKPGKLTIHHVQFEDKGQDKFGYPITKLDVSGDPVVKTVIPYELSYLRDEVIAIIHWLRDHKPSTTKRK